MSPLTRDEIAAITRLFHDPVAEDRETLVAAGRQLLAEIERQDEVIRLNHDGAEYAEELLGKQRAEIDRLRAEVATYADRLDLDAWERKEAELAESRSRECTSLCKDLEQDRDYWEQRAKRAEEVVEAVKAWRAGFPSDGAVEFAVEADRPLIVAIDRYALPSGSGEPGVCGGGCSS